MDGKRARLGSIQVEGVELRNVESMTEDQIRDLVRVLKRGEDEALRECGKTMAKLIYTWSVAQAGMEMSGHQKLCNNFMGFESKCDCCSNSSCDRLCHKSWADWLNAVLARVGWERDNA